MVNLGAHYQEEGAPRARPSSSAARTPRSATTACSCARRPRSRPCPPASTSCSRARRARAALPRALRARAARDRAPRELGRAHPLLHRTPGSTTTASSRSCSPRSTAARASASRSSRRTSSASAAAARAAAPRRRAAAAARPAGRAAALGFVSKFFGEYEPHGMLLIGVVRHLPRALRGRRAACHLAAAGRARWPRPTSSPSSACSARRRASRPRGSTCACTPTCSPSR